MRFLKYDLSFFRRVCQRLMKHSSCNVGGDNCRSAEGAAVKRVGFPLKRFENTCGDVQSNFIKWAYVWAVCDIKKFS